MKILAVDPGPEKSAFVLWDTSEQIIELTGHINTQELIFDLPQLVKDADLVAIEMVQSYGQGVGRTIFLTCLFVGQMIYRLHGHKTVKMYGRPTIKGQIGGRNDAEVRASLRMRFCSCGSKGACRKGCKLHKINNDQRAALALAVALEENPQLKEW